MSVPSAKLRGHRSSRTSAWCRWLSILQASPTLSLFVVAYGPTDTVSNTREQKDKFWVDFDSCCCCWFTHSAYFPCKKLRWHNKSAIDLSNVNPACGHKRNQGQRATSMVTTCYSDQQGSKSRQNVLRLYKQWHQPIPKQFVKPPYSISRAASIDSDYCRLPTTSVHSNKADKLRSNQFWSTSPSFSRPHIVQK